MNVLLGETPYFSGSRGHAYLGDSLALLPKVPSASVDLICTSPPFALLRQKAYGNVHADDYVTWFLQFARQFVRILKPKGSLVIDIGGTWLKGRPERSLYHYELVLQLCKPVSEGGCGFRLSQELYWYNPAKLPTPAEWVTVRRERVKDAVNTVWWLSLDEHPKANNRHVLRQYSEAQVKLMRDGYKPKLRPSEHDISDKFGKNNSGAIPPNIINGGWGKDDAIGEGVFIPTNVIAASNTASNDLYLRLCREHHVTPHPARFPRALPEFAIGLCTEVGDVVLDPFAGSNMTGYTAEKMGRNWVAFEQNEEYLQGANFRFFAPEDDAISYFNEIIGKEKLGAVQNTLEGIDQMAPRQSGKEHRFTYGDQFEPERTPLVDLLEMSVASEPTRDTLQQAIRAKYFEGHGRDLGQRDQNSKTMAMNCLLSMNAYGLIQLTNGGTTYHVTQLARDLLSVKGNPKETYRRFAVHILTNLEGLILARLIERIRARGEKPTLEYLGEEMNELGRRIPPNSTYISTMREWLAQAGVFRSKGYEVNWDVIYTLLKVDKDIIDELYQLPPEQKHFLLSMVSLDQRDFVPSNKIAKHTRSVYKVRLTTKNLVKDVLEPLEEIGLIEMRKTTLGRGAKPHDVRLTQKSINEILLPLLNNLADLTEMTSTDLNRPFEEVVAELKHEDKYVRGIALELLAVWVIRLLGLRFSKWRLRQAEATGNAEVDVMAASDKIVYSCWQIQCKNHAKASVDVDVIAKEVGLSFVTQADVIMVVTTTEFTSSAVTFAHQVSDNSRYYVILLEGEDIERIIKDKTLIVDILNLKARRTFAKREMGITEFDEQFEEEIEAELETEAELEKAIERASSTQLELFGASSDE